MKIEILKGKKIGMKIQILISLIALIGFCNSAKAQCNNRISLERVVTTAPNLNSGTIEVVLTGQGSYTAELYTISGAGKNLVQKKDGLVGQNLFFNNLPPHDSYQLLVIFNDEEQKFCKKRQISEISTLEK